MTRKKREIYGDLSPRSDPSYYKAWFKKNRKHVNEYNRKRRAAGKDPYDPIKAKEYRKTAKSKEGQWRAKGIVDLTLERFQETLLEQQGKCKICKTTLVNPHSDHDHSTGLFRGILCFRCNTDLGIFEKRYEELSAYLHEHKKRIEQ